MALPSVSADTLLLEAYSFYSALTRTAANLNLRSEASLPEANPGGKLLYAGELDARGSAAVLAGNVAGCATLAATADPAVQKQAIRDGTVDFVVTSLDEALRILKNEIRKKATVAVCVGLAPSVIEREMLERGVVPDLVPAGPPDRQGGAEFGPGCREIQPAETDSKQAFLEWRVEQASVRWMSKLDAIALECLQSDVWAHRWIRLSPRYCGRSSQGQRLLWCDPQVAACILEGFGAAIRDCAIETEVSGSMIVVGETNVFRLSPAGV